MHPELLPLLRCPHHRTTTFRLEGHVQRDCDGMIITGELVCSEDGQRFPIVDGIVDLLGWEIPDSPAQLVNMLPITAWSYERLWRYRALTILTGEPFGYNRELPFVAGLLEPRRAGLYIDSACSNGLYARAIAQARGDAPGHVVGIDHSLPMLRQARAFAQRAGLRISFVCAKAEALPFADRAAAGVAMGGSLNELCNPSGALSECRRVMAENGRGVMMSLVQATSAPGRALQSLLAPGGVTFWTLEAHNRQFRAAGLRLMSQWRYQVVVFSLLKPFMTHID